MKNQKALERIQKCREEQADFLDLGNMALTEIPAEVFELTHLRRLNLGARYYQDGEWINNKNNEGNNQLRSLPPAVNRLHHLEELSLEGNPIEAPEILSQLPRLERLNIGRTGLKSLDILKEAPRLKALSINGLELRSLTRLSEYALPELMALDVSNNGLQKIEALGHFPQLRYLNLSINRIPEVEGLHNLKHLKALYLGLNRILEIKNLENLTGLEILSFGYLGGHYQEYFLQDYYRSNFIREIENLDHLPHLRKLDLSGNLIREIKGLETLTELETLYLGHNQIEELAGIGHLGKLRFFSLGYVNPDYNTNALLENNEFFDDQKPKANLVSIMDGLTSLQQLSFISLDNNILHSISGLDNIQKLEELNLAGNQIFEVSNLDKLRSLKTLDLFGNQIREIKNLQNLSNLEKLILGSNQIEEINHLETLESLEYLNLTHNNIDEIENLNTLTNLQTLFLDSNQISEIKNLNTLTNLQTLFLDSNQISEVKNLDALPNLESLSLSSNQISEIKNLDALFKLRSLSLSSNQISEIKNLDAMTSLRSLYLGANQISEIKNLDTLTNLEFLYLWSNQISEIKNLDTLINLQHLNLNSNQISEIKNFDTLNNLQSLYLHSNQISEIKNLDTMPQLRFLFLWANHISEIKNLNALGNLQYLYLGSNQISEIRNLDTLVTLRTLSLHSNQISEIKNLDALCNLQRLDLSSNQISEIKNLDTLVALRILSLHSNQIVEIKNLGTLSKLEILELNKNQIREIKNLDALTELQTLAVDSNQISEIRNLEVLIELQSLAINSNQIVEIKNLDTLSKLERLELNKNKIREIKNLENLPYLQYLYLNENQIAETQPLKGIPLLAEVELNENWLSYFDPELLEMPNILRLFLAKNEFVNIPSEIANLNNCLHDARAWFRDLERESVENFEVKLMLAGNGRVGKTSVLKRLFRNEFDPEEDSTHGIQLYMHDVPVDFCGQPLRIHAWDFGGQEIYHATHRLFMQSRALYLALWDWETEHKAFATENIAGETVRFRNYELTYWLDHARSLSWQSPLLVVQNKIDQHRRQWPKHLNELQERYDIINFLHVSAATGEGAAILKTTLLEEFRKMPEAGMKTPAQWQRVKEKLLAMKAGNKTIPFSRFQEICREEELDASSTGALIRFLHNTGNLFYQSHLFQDQVILDQEWALEGLYALFQRGPFYKQLKFAGGRTSLDILAWPWQQYDLHTRKIFLSMMESCEICFKVTEDEKDPEYIITEFLPDEKDDKVVTFWEKSTENELFLRYQTNFFHPAFITRFIARAGRMAKSYDHIWRNGIWITFEKAHALIEAFPEEHQILVRVKGDPAMLLLYLIHQAFREIFYDPDAVAMDISLAGQEFLQYREIKEGKTKGLKKVLSHSRRMVDLEKVDFFTEVLDARSEDEVKRKLSDIVPKPKIKISEGSAEPMETLTAESFRELKEKLKGEIGKDLEQALESTNQLLLDGPLKNELITIQGRYADLKKFMSSGRIGFEDYDKHNNQIRAGLIDIIDRIENAEINVEKALKYL